MINIYFDREISKFAHEFQRYMQMNNFTGFLTKDGKPVLTNEFINELREREKDKIQSNNFIAQLGPQEDDLHASVDILITGGNRGGGKANPYDTPIITPDGMRLMGDLKIGDRICTPYEGVQRVTNIFEKGMNTIYTFHFDDGTTLQCMDEHRFWAKKVCSGDFKEYTARELMDNYKIDAKFPMSLRRGKELVEIPICGEVDINEEMTPLDLPIHPFIFGHICGSGSWDFSKQGVYLKNSPTIVRAAFKYGYKVKIINGIYYLRGVTDDNRRKITCCRNEQPSRIPKEYLTASVQARWDLLRGIFVENGRSKSKHPYLANTNKKFIEDVATLARSLGMWAKVSEVLDDPERIGQWQVQIIAPNDKDIWVKNTYKERAHENAAKPKDPSSRGCLTKKVLYVTKNKTKKNCRCITVSGNHHLYLSDDFTINHNTFTLLMEPMYDIDNPRFNGIIFRKEKDDLTNIIRDSRLLYSPFGHFNKSKDDLTWYFDSQAELSLTYYADAYDDFKDRFQGRQYSYIGIDEITQIEYEKFKYLITCNRNAANIKNRIIGTCNPDPLSWVRKFIDWWIGEDGFAIPERNGVIRYCYMKGDSVDTIVWGDTPEEVYEQCKDEIDKLWQPEYGEMGFRKETMFTKSVTFIRAELKYNKKLLQTDPNYVGGLAQQGEEQQARDLQGNWNFMSMGDDLIKMVHLQRCFQNPQMRGDGVHRATCDVAFTGGDNCVLWHWIGWHVEDVFVCKLDSVDTCRAIKAKLEEWGVLEKNFTYDLNGLGQTFKGFFKEARPFNNVEAVAQRFKNIYDNKKSQCMYLFAKKIIAGEISFNEDILRRKFEVGKKNGRKGQVMYLADILQLERKCVRQDESKADKGWCIIKKEQMKQLVGWSPDFWESLMMRQDFEVSQRTIAIPSWIRNF